MKQNKYHYKYDDEYTSKVTKICKCGHSVAIYNKEGNKCWVAIEYAKNYYSRFYLETLVKKEHFACDIRYI